MLCPGRVGREPCTHPGSARYQRVRVRPAVREGQAETTTRELLRVLAYPKFRLQPVDRERLLEDLLPWCESWVAAIPSSQHRVRDPDDQVFLDLALAAATPVLVSGDADLLALKEEMPPCKSSTQPNFSVG